MFSPDWPILKKYGPDHLGRIALPLGGIGTGTLSLGGRGDLRDWEVGNRPAKGFVPTVARVGPFFALYAQAGSAPAVTRLLEGPLELGAYEGSSGSPVPNHGLPRFKDCTFGAAYPLGQVFLTDSALPLSVRLEAFNPLIPPDAARSGLPVAILRYMLMNPGDAPVAATVAGSLPNFLGTDGSQGPPGPKGNRNAYRAAEGLCGIFMTTEGVASTAEQFGTLALAVAVESQEASPGVTVSANRSAEITYRTDWLKPHWGTSLLDFWDDLSADGRLETRPMSGAEMPIASLAAGVTVPPHGTRAVTFVIAWHFPNRMTWTPKQEGASCDCAGDGACADPNWIGNYYTTQYRDAWDVVEKVVPQLPALEEDTVAFVSAFCASDLPEVVKEAALFNVSTLRSQTCFRTPDGRFYGWEGCHDQSGCCHGSCTHVWNYDLTTPFLFGNLAKRMREVEFGQATRDDGMMAFRANLPLGRAQEFGKAAADGQMGCIMKLYREWQLSGDDDLLRALWPKARAAVEFCWIAGGWDADQDGVMEGCQHNTMDVEYYGPNPQMEGWYLGALRAAEEMARYLGETRFAATCHDLFGRGRACTDGHLFNGE
jgi:non-lysosomal glucosylceramidase